MSEKFQDIAKGQLPTDSRGEVLGSGTPYAELRLYFGFVTNHLNRFMEGRFEHDPTDSGSQRAVALAKEDIERFLQPGWEYGLHFGTGYVASNEQEAAQLIAHAEANIPNSHGSVVPHDVTHGALRFVRVIRFDGAKRESIDEIVEKMKKSGHLPYTKLEARRDFIDGEEKYLKKNDEKWKAAFKFY